MLGTLDDLSVQDVKAAPTSTGAYMHNRLNNYTIKGCQGEELSPWVDWKCFVATSTLTDQDVQTGNADFMASIYLGEGDRTQMHMKVHDAYPTRTPRCDVLVCAKDGATMPTAWRGRLERDGRL